MVKRLASIGFALALIGACGGPKIVASAFDQGCNADADCIAVRVGDPCACVPQWDGIAKSEQARYEEESRGMYTDAARASCTSCREPVGQSGKAICSARRCMAVVKGP